MVLRGEIKEREKSKERVMKKGFKAVLDKRKRNVSRAGKIIIKRGGGDRGGLEKRPTIESGAVKIKSKKK